MATRAREMGNHFFASAGSRLRYEIRSSFLNTDSMITAAKD